MPGEEDVLGYTLCAYFGRGLPPERSEFTDLAKAEKAFTDAKAVAILWQTRPPSQGLGWVKLKEKDAPPPAPPVAAKPTGAPAPASAPKPV